MFRKIGLKCLIIILFISLLGLFKVKSVKAEDNLIKYGKSAVLIELNSGKVLYEYNAHARYEPASMTKMMTMKLVMDAIHSKRIDKEQIITTSEHASKMGGTQIYLAENEKMKVEDLFKSMVIASANDAAVSLAEAVSGSEHYFVSAMNNEVKRLGLENTFFMNATGLPTMGHYSSSYDMAMIARSLLLAYEEEIIPYTSTYESYVRENTDKPFWLVNTNKLIKNVEGIDGLKTGWTEGAGYCITTTMKKDGMRLISVVMGADTVAHRSVDTLSLLNYGFSNYDLVVLKEKGERVIIENDILVSPNEYHVITNTKVSVVKLKNEKLDEVRYEVKLYKDRIRNLHSKNVGTMKVYVGDNLIQEVGLDLEEVPKKVSFIELLLNVLKSIF